MARGDNNLTADEVGGEVEALAGFESKEFDVCTMCYPICSDQPSCDVEMPCYKRLNDMSFTSRYRYDEECNCILVGDCEG